MALSEFDLIQHYFAAPAFAGVPATGVILGIGDDAALLRVPDGADLVVSVDTLVSAVHFPVELPPEHIGWRALAVNLSDLAAMGAMPLWFSLALTLPEVEEAWLARFSEGLASVARRFGIALVGGDTTRGPLTITIGVYGAVPRGAALRRDGAKAGDQLYVTGAPGTAALGLRRWQHGVDSDDDAVATFLHPEPRLAFGQRLRGIATAMIDVSDGLLADAGHIAERSGVGIVVDSAAALAPELATTGGDDALMLCLSGGDDYELCFSAATTTAGAIATIAEELGVRCTRIGHIVTGQGVSCAGFQPPRTGYQHF